MRSKTKKTSTFSGILYYSGNIGEEQKKEDQPAFRCSEQKKKGPTGGPPVEDLYFNPNQNSAAKSGVLQKRKSSPLE